MGDRASIELQYEVPDGLVPPKSIFIYTHWGATGSATTLAEAIERGMSRWDEGNESYLARVIASAFFKNAGIDDTTGAGLSLTAEGTVFWVVNLKTKTVTLAVQYADEFGVPFAVPLSYEAFITAVKLAADKED